MMGYMASDTGDQLKLLSHFARIVSITSLDELLAIAIKDIPSLVNGVGCSIYLRPEFVPQYDRNLINETGQMIQAEQIKQEFLVLAATSRPGTEKLIGKAFYETGYGLGGWVFKHGKPLRLKDSSDKEELHAIADDIHWSDKYGGSKVYYGDNDKKPILIVPLLEQTRTIGILKIPATANKWPFTPFSEAIAILIAQIIASAIHTSWFIREQSQNIFQLAEIGAKSKLQEVLEAVTYHLSNLLEHRKCQFYLRDRNGGVVKLAFENGKHVPDTNPPIYERGQDLIGWVFNTGKPLLIGDVRNYKDEQFLGDPHLEWISDGPRINKQDRRLKCERVWPDEHDNAPLPFLAVSVKANDGSVLGVLCINCLDDVNNRPTIPFNRTHLQLAQSFASTISLAIANERQRKVGELLTQLGYSWDLKRLYNLIVQQIPESIFGTCCHIFGLEQGPPNDYLRLLNLSREGALAGDIGPGITYAIGEGKTGFCALAQAMLVVNHYGQGEVTGQSMITEIKRITNRYPNDLLADLKDENGNRVGFVQLRQGLETSKQVQEEFKKLTDSLVVYRGIGIPSVKSQEYARLGSQSPWSFAAAPIKSENGDLYGVISIARRVDRSPFSPDDVNLLHSIAGRLAAVLVNQEMLKQRERLLVTLAHEINTPVQGMLADTENLKYELPRESELKTLVEHSLNQVLQLHMLTENIMTVLMEGTPSREFAVHSIYQLLKEACDMFNSEAAAKGCNILDPQAIDSRFPNIKMSEFDLKLAFKNLIHNAVKYSFYRKRPHDGEEKRYISITGCWADKEHQYYSISIQNYGVGITEEEISQRRIFAPYYRGVNASDRRRTGGGFGLAYVSRIIEDMHHGSIEVTSKLLWGKAYLTTFTVTLPLKQPGSESPTS